VEAAKLAVKFNFEVVCIWITIVAGTPVQNEPVIRLTITKLGWKGVLRLTEKGDRAEMFYRRLPRGWGEEPWVSKRKFGWHITRT
jgi:hypothetical protein